MDLRQIHYFLAIARTGSFTGAAEELFVSQSSLSKQIIALERELGVQLFDRSRRKVALTDAGRTFRRHALKFHQVHQAMVGDLEEFRPESEPLSIVAIPVIAQYGIPKYIAAFREAHPGLRLTLDEREAAEILPALNDRRYDLAFVRDNCVDPEVYSCQELSRDRLIAVVPGHHSMASKSVVSLRELADEDFIVLDKASAVYQLVLDACREAGFEPRVVHSTLRNDSIIALGGGEHGHRSDDGAALRLLQTPGRSGHPAGGSHRECHRAGLPEGPQTVRVGARPGGRHHRSRRTGGR